MTDDKRTQQSFGPTQDESNQPTFQPSNHPITQSPIGAVMVIGGGIAGMQASLDLAEAGFKVYLVESKSAIGGHMAQLDKTFPTNDCAMCTISPKLNEVGSNLNIQVLVDTEVVDVQGGAGNFTATLRRKPRYIDLTKCVGCGDCEKVCPIVIPDPYNADLSQRHAVYRLYPQAVPSAFAIEKRGIAPCRDACPAHQRAQGYIALIREKRFADACRVIKEDNPFPSICGRVCIAKCETACNRGTLDAPVAIRDLKRFVADWTYEQQIQNSKFEIPNSNPKSEIRNPKSVAVVGSGPAGMTCAADLARLGYRVTVFEALPVAGGMMRVGVPNFRLPHDRVQKEIDDIVALGVELRLNARVEDVEKLFADGYAAVFTAVGSHKGRKLPIPGADHPDSILSLDLLRDASVALEPQATASDKQAIENHKSKIENRRVLVLGGGAVAIDAAMTARRLGAANVAMACLESRDIMPAPKEEIAQVEQEGVAIHPSRSFTRVVVSDSKITGVECVNVKKFAFEKDGRLILETHPNTEHIIECDTVIFAIGQGPDLALIQNAQGVEQTKRRTIAVDPETLATGRRGLFAGGDAVTGVGFIIDAIGVGHRAANSIHAYLQQTADDRPQTAPVVKLTREEIATRIESGRTSGRERVEAHLAPAAERVKTFDEFAFALSEEQAVVEAERCLACGVCSECLECVYACKRGAVAHDMIERTEQVNVGAVILAPGYQIYRAELSEEYGLGRYPNVVTSLQFERLLSASGPTRGHVKRPSDGASPKRIAFLQCVGSRDQSHDYCSSVCCMYAAKEAIMALEHAKVEGNDGKVECQVFFMDTRAFSKGYEEYYRRAEKKYGVKYTRSRISALRENPATGNLVVRYASAEDAETRGHGDTEKDSPRHYVTASPRLIEEEFDLVVLSVGMEIAESVKQLGRKLGIELDPYGFCHTTLFDPLQSSRAGVYVAGPFREPKDIPETVMEASGAATAAARLLASARHTLVRQREYPPELDVATQSPRVGVFVCHCGSNIGGYLDVPGVAEYARTLPGVVHAEDNLYTCSQDTIAHIIAQTKELNLNRVVVASCTPLTHEPLFQDAIRQAGLNPYLFEMANIRNQCSWVHGNDRAGATEKAKTLVRMAVARSSRLEALRTAEVSVNHAALIIGGGAAGMNAALSLADQGFPVHLVERADQLGGNLRHLRFLPNWQIDGSRFEDAQAYLRDLVGRVETHPLITTHLNSELIETGGFKGNFVSTLRRDGESLQVSHGATIVATGGVEYKGKEYGYGKDARIVTQLEFEERIANYELGIAKNQLVDRNSQFAIPNSVVMIQCVGPGEKYCSRLCCTTALKNALKLKELNPSARVTILFRDIRTYGFKERLYTEARRAGVIFVRYDFDRKPEVEIAGSNKQQAGSSKQQAGSDSSLDTRHSSLTIRVWEPVLQQELVLNADLLVLSMPIVAAKGARELATALKVPVDMDGWFLEAHVKLRPVDFASDGVFMAGVAHYPKFLDETIAQAQAAAARAANILAQEKMLTSARAAVVDPAHCVGCLTCVRSCPYHVPKIVPNQIGVGSILGAAFIETAICHGCGICAAECPAKAIQLLHSTDAQNLTKVDALFGFQISDFRLPITDLLNRKSEIEN